MLDIRLADDAKSIADYKAVYEEVWRSGEPFGEGELDPGDGSLRYIAYQSDERVASFKVHRYAVTAGSAVLSCAGVASVAVLPVHRGSKIGQELMRWAVPEMKAQGFEVAALYAFRESFYEKFGYRTVGMRWKIKCPLDRFPKLECSLPIRRIAPSQLELLYDCYSQFISNLDGANVRSPKDWQNRMGKRPPMIYAAGDPVEAYAWLTPSGEFWSDVILGEFCWSTRRGYESLLAFAKTLCINQNALVWTEPTQGQFMSRFLDQGVGLELYRPAMYRVLDAPVILEKLASDCKLTEPFTLTDPLIEANNIVQVGSKFSMDIGELTQCIFADPSQSQPQKVPQRPVFCTEFF